MTDHNTVDAEYARRAAAKKNAFDFLQNKKSERALLVPIWLRRKDLNQRPSGYEPDELPTALLRDVFNTIPHKARIVNSKRIFLARHYPTCF